jgi:hypothetical protein
MAVTQLDLIRRGKGSGVDSSLYLKSDGAGGWMLATRGSLVYSALIGDGTTNPWVVTHNLGTTNVVTVVSIASTGEVIEGTVTIVNSNSISINFAFENIPTTNQYTVAVFGAVAGGAGGGLSLGIVLPADVPFL